MGNHEYVHRHGHGVSSATSFLEVKAGFEVILSEKARIGSVRRRGFVCGAIKPMARAHQNFLAGEWAERLIIERASPILRYSHPDRNAAAVANHDAWPATQVKGIQAHPMPPVSLWMHFVGLCCLHEDKPCERGNNKKASQRFRRNTMAHVKSKVRSARLPLERKLQCKRKASGFGSGAYSAKLLVGTRQRVLRLEPTAPVRGRLRMLEPGR